MPNKIDTVTGLTIPAEEVIIQGVGGETVLPTQEPIRGVDLAGYEDYLGKDFNILTQDVDDMRAHAQSGLAKGALFVPRALTTAITEIGKMPGYIGGALMYAESGDISDVVNNSWINFFEDMDEEIKETIPVFMKKSVTEGNLWDNLTDPGFWATEGADAAGFFASMIVPGAALKGLGVAAGISRMGVGVGGKVGSAIAKSGQFIENSTAIGLNTLFEAGAEAGGAYDNMMTSLEGQINPTTGVEYTEDERKAKAGEVAANIMEANAYILVLPNALMHQSLFGRFAKGTGPLGRKGADGLIRMKKRLPEILKRTGISVASEGFFEEGMQFSAEEYFTNKAKGLTDKGVIEGMIEAYGHALTTTEGQKAIALGSIIGGLAGGVRGGILSTKQFNQNAVALNQLLSMTPQGVSNILSEMYEKKDDGTFSLDSNGNLQKRQSKINNTVEKLANDVLTDAIAKYFIETNNVEGSEFIENELILDAAYEFLSLEGGDVILKDNFDSIVDEIAQANGRDPSVFKEKIKKFIPALKSQMELLNLHSSNYFGVKGEPQQVAEFTNKVKHAAFLEYGRELYLKDRIKTLTKKAEEAETEDTELSKKNATEIRKQIEIFQEDLKKSKERSKAVFSKKAQQEVFDAQVIEEKEVEETAEDVTAKEIKTQGLSGPLQGLYNALIKTYDIPLKRKEGSTKEKLEVSGELMIDTGDTFKLSGVTRNGKIALRGKEGILLIGDEGMTLNGEALESEIRISKTPQQALEELHAKARINSLTKIANNNKSAIDNIQKKITDKLQTIEDYTAAIQRALSNKTKRAKVDNTMLGVVAIEAKIEEVKAEIEVLKGKVDIFEEQNTIIDEQIAKAEEEGYNPENVKATANNLRIKSEEYGKFIEDTETTISSLKKYISRLKSAIKGFATRIRNILGLPKDASDVDVIQKVAEIDLEKSNTLGTETYKDGVRQKSSTIVDELAGAQGNFESSEEKLELSETQIKDLQEELDKAKAAKAGVDEYLRKLNKQYEDFRKEFIKLIDKERLLKKEKYQRDVNPDTNEQRDEFEEEVFEFHSTKFSPPKPPFTGWTSFLRTAANEDDSATSDWFKWLNKTFDFNNVHFIAYTKENLPEELKDKVKFYEEEGITDIKLVAYNTKTNQPIGVSASMQDPRGKTPFKYDSGHDRFSYEKHRIKHKNLNKEDYAKKLEEDHTNALRKYIEFREKVISKGPVRFIVTGRNPGAKLPPAEPGKAYSRIFKTIKELRQLVKDGKIFVATQASEDIVEGEKYVTVTYGGRDWRVKRGFAYVKHQGHLELLRPQTLAETGDTQRVFNLLQYYIALEDKKSDEAKKVRKQLGSILWFGKPNNAKNSKYRFYIENDNLYMGNRVFNLAEFAERKEEILDFLSQKYHHVSSVNLNAQHYEMLDVVDGKLKTVKIFDESKVGYAGYLLNDETPRAVLNLKTLEEQQFINASLNIEESKGKVTFTKDEDGKVKANVEEFPVGDSLTPEPEVQEVADENNMLKNDGNFNITFKTGNTITVTKKDNKVTVNKTLNLKDGTTSELPEEMIILLTANINQSLENEENYINWYEDGVDKIEKVVSKEVVEEVEEVVSDEVYNKFVDTGDIEVEHLKTLVQRIKDGKTLTKREIAIYQAKGKEIEDLLKEETSEEDDDLLDEQYRLAEGPAGNDVKEQIEWLRKKFPDIPVRKVIGLIRGKAHGMLSKNLEVFLSDVAAKGTNFHEAFHIIEQLFLTPNERQRLYAEANRSLGKTLKDSEASELLAEELRYFLLSPDTYKFGENRVKQNFFERVWNIIKAFFGVHINKENEFPYEIEKLFNLIKDTPEFRLKDKKGTLLRDHFSIGGLSESKSVALMKNMNVFFFNSIIRTENPAETLYTFEDTIDGLYDAVKQMYGKIKVTDGRDFLLDHFDETVEKHKRFLKQYGIQIPEITEVDENDTGNNDKRESNKISVRDLIPQEIKLLLAGIPKAEIVINKEGEEVIRPVKFETFEEFKHRETVEFQNTVRMLHNNLHGLVEYSDMIDKLREMSEQFPYLNSLIGRLGSTTTLVPNNKYRAALIGQFHKQFSKAKNNPIIYSIDGTTHRAISANANTLQAIVLSNWKNNIKLNDSFEKNAQGRYVLKDKSIVGLKLEDLKTPQAKLEVLSKLGMNLKDYELTNEDMEVITEFLKFSLSRIKIGTLADDIYSSEGLELKGRIDKLTAIASRFLTDDVELNYLDSKGNTVYSITLNSYISKLIAKLNKSIPPHLNPNVNLYTKNSIWLEQELLLGDINGAQSLSDNREVSAMSHKDFTSLHFTSVLNGRYPLLRAADRGMEYFISGPQFNADLTRDGIIDRLKGYIKDEVAMYAANVGSNMEYYSKNTKGLMFFSEILEGIPLTLTEDGTFHEKAEAWVEANDADITKALEAYLTKSQENVKQKLIDNGVLKDDVLEVDKKTLEKIGSNERAIELFNYHWITSAIEQTKLFFGPPTSFKNQGDFYKRTTMFVSTKNDMINDREFNEVATELIPRVDERAYDGNFNFNVVNDDMSVTDEETLSHIPTKYHKAYKDLNKADAQAVITPTFAREILFRNGNIKGEKTYQYEMQKLFIEEKNDKWFQDKYEEHFKEHLPKGMTLERAKVPYWNGEAINEWNLDAIEVFKPQGVGPVLNVKDAQFNSLIKISAATLMPSILPKKSIHRKRLIDMLKKGTDMVVFRSGNKGDTFGTQHAYKEDGSYNPLVNDFQTQMSIDNIGIQLETQDSNAKKVMYSQQMNRLENQDGGLLELFEGKNAIVHEYKRRKREELLAELGLNEDGTLIDNNADKFKKRLIKAFDLRQLPDNYIEGINLALDSPSKLIDTLIVKREVEAVMMSLFKNDVIQTKVNGAFYPQESSSGYELETKGNHLKFYRKDDKGNTLPMEVEMTLPSSYKNYVKKNFGSVEAFNKAIKEGKVDKELYTFAGNRTPAQGMNSLEGFTVVRFLPPYVGKRIILPAEIVAKTGSDFDIDKLNVYINNIDFKGNFLKFYTEVNEANLKEAYDAQFGKPPPRNYEEYLEQKKNDTVENSAMLEWLDQKGEITRADFETLTKEIPPTFAEFKVLVGDNAMLLNSNAALENEMFRYSLANILDPNRFDQLIRPLDSTVLKDLAANDKIIIKPSQTKIKPLNWTNLLEWGTSLDKAKFNWAGNMGVAQAALQTTSHALTQKKNVHIKDPLVKIYLEGQELTENNPSYYMGHETTEDGNRISYLFGEFLSAYVDIAKEELPYIFQLNAISTVFPTYGFLLRTSNTKPASIKKIAKLATHPIVRRYTELMNQNNSMTTNKRFQKEILKQVGKEFKISTDNFISGEYREYFNETNAILRENKAGTIEKKLSALNYKYLTEKDINSGKYDAQILDNFITYQLYAKRLTDFQRATQPEGGLGKSRAYEKVRQESIAAIKELDFYEREDIENFVNDTYLREYEKSHQVALSAYSKMFRSSIDNVFSYFKGLPLDNKGYEKFYERVEDDYTTYIFESQKLNKDYKRLMMGDNSLAKRLVSLEKKYPDQYLLTSLKVHIDEFVKRTGKNVPIDNISLFNKKMTTEDNNILVSSFKELIESGNPELQSFAKDLMHFSVIQTGFANSFVRFSQVVPQEYFQQIANEVFNTYFPSPENFVEQFYQNNWHDKGIVPSQSHLVRAHPESGLTWTSVFDNAEENSFGIPFKSMEGKFPYLTVDIPTVDRKEQKRLKEEGHTIPKERRLYKRVSITDGGISRYERINKLGAGHRFKEYYPDKGTPSIIAENNIGGVTQPTVNSVNIATKNYTRALVKANPNIAYVFTENTHSITAFPNRSGGGSAVIRPEANAYAIVTKKKYDYNTKENVDYSNTEADFKEFTAINTKLINQLKGANKPIVFPQGFGTDKAKLPTRFAEWLQKKLLNEFGLVTELNNSKTGLISKEVVSEPKQLSLDFPVGDSLFSFSTETKTTPELQERMNNFFKAIGVNVEQVEQIYDNKGQKINATAVAKLSEMTVEYLKGSEAQLPEEAAHFYTAMLPANHPLLKRMLSQIENYEIYDRIKADPNYAHYPDELTYRYEAIGQVIANHMQGKSSTPQVKNWWNALLKYIKSLFSKTTTDDFAQAAYNILNSEVKDLETSVVVEEGLLSTKLSLNQIDSDVKEYIKKWLKNNYVRSNFGSDVIKSMSPTLWKETNKIFNPNFNKNTFENLVDIAEEIKTLRKDLKSKVGAFSRTTKSHDANSFQGFNQILDKIENNITELSNLGIEIQLNKTDFTNELHSMRSDFLNEFENRKSGGNAYTIVSKFNKEISNLIDSNFNFPERIIEDYLLKNPPSQDLYSFKMSLNQISDKFNMNNNGFMPQNVNFVELTKAVKDKVGIKVKQASSGSYYLSENGRFINPRVEKTKTKVVENNMRELRIEEQEREMREEMMLRDFEVQYPQYKDLTTEERQFLIDQMSDGELETICGL